MDAQTYAPETVEVLLYEAGRTHMALRVPGCWPAGIRSGMPQPAVEPDDLATAAPDETSIPQPNARQVDAHDLAYGWVNRLPWSTPAEIRVRKLVLDRMRISPKTGRPVFNWTALGRRHNISHTWAKTLWVRAVDALTAIANRPLPATCGATWARIRALSTAHGLGVGIVRPAAAPASHGPFALLQRTAARVMPATCAETVRRITETAARPVCVAAAIFEPA